MAARAGSTRATVELLHRLLVTDSIVTTLHRETNSRRMRSRSRTATDDAEGLWEGLAAHMESVPESEYERRRRVGALRGHSVDATHPPTDLRRRLLLSGPPMPASVTIDATRSGRIADAPANARKALVRRLMRDGFSEA
ncbi:hypothetical protein [Streptomyces sp. NPDC002758]